MPLEVVDAHDGKILGRRQTLGVCIAHQKRGDEAGMAGHGNAVKPVNANPGFTEGGLDDRVDVLQVLAGRKLGYDAAVCRMELDLAAYDARQDFVPVLDDCGGSLVATAFNSEDVHFSLRLLGRGIRLSVLKSSRLLKETVSTQVILKESHCSLSMSSSCCGCWR